jgi:hypothetical protein
MKLLKLCKDFSDDLNEKFKSDKNEETKEMIKGKNFKVHFSQIDCNIMQSTATKYSEFVECLLDSEYAVT